VAGVRVTESRDQGAQPGACVSRHAPDLAFAENLPILCWIARADGWISWYNRRWYEFTGTTPADMEGWGWQSVHDPERLPDVMERWTLSIQTGQPFDMTFPLRAADGSFRPFLTRVTPHRDNSGAIQNWFGVNIDVGDLHDSQKALRDSEARYRAAMILGRMASWETNFGTGLRHWTHEGMDLFGLDLPNGIGSADPARDEFIAAVHPDDRHLIPGFREAARLRDSFSAEYRIRRPDGDVRWVSGFGEVVKRASDGSVLRLASVVTDITARKKADEHTQFLMRELSHRSKNLLAVILAIADQTKRHATSLDGFYKTLVERARGLAMSNDLLVQGDWRGASLGELIGLQLSPFVDVKGPRVACGGPDVSLSAAATQAIGLALHELATNAVKYGALSTPGGCVAIEWDVIPGGDARRAVRLAWSERGGPPVEPVQHKGFGTSVIQRMVEQSIAATVAMVFSVEGLDWSVIIPPDELIEA
jgi:PAS domain S-box-containing protein